MSHPQEGPPTSWNEYKTNTSEMLTSVFNSKLVLKQHIIEHETIETLRSRRELKLKNTQTPEFFLEMSKDPKSESRIQRF